MTTLPRLLLPVGGNWSGKSLMLTKRQCLPFLWAVNRRKITLSATISFFLPDVASPFPPLGVMGVQHSIGRGEETLCSQAINYPLLLYPSTERGELARLFRSVGILKSCIPIIATRSALASRQEAVDATENNCNRGDFLRGIGTLREPMRSQ